MDKAADEIRNLKNKQTELIGRGQDNNTRIEEARKEIEHLASQAGKQEHILQQISSDTHKAWRWIQQHKSEFEMDVFGPPTVECSVKDPRYVNLIEALMQKNQLLSFTVQTSNDFKKLSDVLSERLRLSEINIKTMSVGLDKFPPPLSTEEMAQYGFESWALQHLEGPEPVLAMLCAEIRLHETGVSLRDTNEAQFNMLQRSQLSSWVTSNFVYRITRRREYGDGATSTRTVQVKPARVWTNQPVDVTIGRDIQERIAAWEEEVEACRVEVEGIKPHIAAFREEYKAHKEESDSLSKEKSAKQKARGDFDTLPTKLAQQEAKKAVVETNQGNLISAKKKFERELDDLAIQRAQIALKYAEAVEQLQIKHNQLYEVEIMSIEASSDFEILTENNRHVNEMLEAKEKELNEVSKVSVATREEAAKCLEACRDRLVGISEEQKTFLNGLSQTSVEELQNEIQAEQSRLELMHEGNGSVIKEFEQRAKKIEAVVSKLDDCKAARAELDQLISSSQAEWEPKLDELVAQISEAFSFNMEQISCAGEVGVWKDEDFDQWAIQVKVKFR